MSQTFSKLGLAAIALCGLMLLPGVSWGQKKELPRRVQDDAGFFNKAAIDEANSIIKTIKQKHKKDLWVETVTEGPAEKDYNSWARERAKNSTIQGVYVVITKKPKDFRVLVGKGTLSSGVFTKENEKELVDILRRNLKAGEPNRALTEVARHTLSAMNDHVRANAPAPVRQAPVADPDKPAAPPWLGWVCMIVAVLLVVWVVFALIRAIATPVGGGYGYGGGGYGYGGGGFFTGMLGGMFGAMAGMWIYNNMFGGHATYGPNGGVNWGGDQGASGAAAGGARDTDYDVAGGSYDDGKGGGDADKAGGDFAGGGDDKDGGGGGDWGGGGDAGGGDAGGGGDWGGGGDAGGGGGGDWGGGGDAGGGGGDFGGGGGDFGGGGGGDW